jgi:hypothetical protein
MHWERTSEFSFPGWLISRIPMLAPCFSSKIFLKISELTKSPKTGAKRYTSSMKSSAGYGKCVSSFSSACPFSLHPRPQQTVEGRSHRDLP